MNFSKRHLLSIVTLIVLASLAACGGTPTPEPTTPRPTRAPIVATQAPQVVPTKAPPSNNAQGDDLAQVQAKKKLVVGTSADYAPFEFYASDNSLDGFDVAVIREVAKRMGVDVEIQDYAFDGLFDALKLGQMDAAIAALSITPQRQQIADFSVPYYLGEDAALARSDANFEIHAASDTIGRKTGVQRGTVFESWLANAYLNADIASPGSNFVTYENANEMLQGLRNKQVDVAILGAQPALAASKPGDLKLVGQAMNAQQYGIAARKGSTLIPEFNRVLLGMYQDGSLLALMQHYLELDSQEGLPLPEVPQVVPTVAPQQPIPVTPTPSAQTCVLGMTFVTDVNLDDQNMKAPPVMQPNQAFNKIWRIQNSGSCAWQPDFALVYTRGNVADARMGGSSVPLGKVVNPGETIDVRADLVAPFNPGTYQGFWQIRSNANTAFGKIIWVGITVPGAQPVQPTIPNLRLRADALQISQGQCTVVRWDVDNASNVAFVDGNNAQGVNPHDSRTVCPQATTTYKLRATLNNQTVEAPLTITVLTAGANLRADRAQINQGECTVVRWNVSSANAIYFFNGSGEEGVGGGDQRTVCPQATTTYRLRVVNPDNSQNTYETTVNVSGGAPQIDFRTDRGTIQRGQCATITWNVNNVQAVYLNDGSGEIGVPGSGQRQVCPVQHTTYTMRAVLQNGKNETRSVSVNVQHVPPPQPTAVPPKPAGGKPRIQNFTVDKNKIKKGGCVNLQWATKNTPVGVTLQRDGATILETGPANGTQQDCPPGSGLFTYTLIAAGEGIGDQAVRQSLTVQMTK